jgi:hypothetical protein
MYKIRVLHEKLKWTERWVVLTVRETNGESAQWLNRRTMEWFCRLVGFAVLVRTVSTWKLMPSSLDELPAHIYLESHPTRNKAVAVSNVSPGSVVLEVPSMPSWWFCCCPQPKVTDVISACPHWGSPGVLGVVPMLAAPLSSGQRILHFSDWATKYHIPPRIWSDTVMFRWQ